MRALILIGRSGARYFTALSMRLYTICSSDNLSVMISPACGSTVMAPPPGAVWWCTEAAAAFSSALRSTRSGRSVRAPSREIFRIALTSRSILAVEERINPIASGISVDSACFASVMTASDAWASLCKAGRPTI